MMPPLAHGLAWLLICLIAFAPGVVQAQSEQLARTLALGKALQAAKSEAERDSINSLLKSALRATLDAPDGLHVNLDELPLSRVEAADGRFRLITWNLPKEDGSHAYEGFLLARNGKVTTLFELRDQTRSITNPELAELGPERWYGALYYQAVPVKQGGKTWYTLLGWKGHSATETRKVIEVLSFRSGKPRFGAPIFGKRTDSDAGASKLKDHRKVFAYAFNASMLLRHEAEQGRMVLDHLSPLRADLTGKGALMAPDMSFDAYKWHKGKWLLERDIDLRDPKRDGKPFKAPPKDPSPSR